MFTPSEYRGVLYCFKNLSQGHTVLCTRLYISLSKFAPRLKAGDHNRYRVGLMGRYCTVTSLSELCTRTNVGRNRVVDAAADCVHEKLRTNSGSNARRRLVTYQRRLMNAIHAEQRLTYEYVPVRRHVSKSQQPMTSVQWHDGDAITSSEIINNQSHETR